MDDFVSYTFLPSPSSSSFPSAALLNDPHDASTYLLLSPTSSLLLLLSLASASARRPLSACDHDSLIMPTDVVVIVTAVGANEFCESRASPTDAGSGGDTEVGAHYAQHTLQCGVLRRSGHASSPLLQTLSLSLFLSLSLSLSLFPGKVQRETRVSACGRRRSG